MIFFNFISVIPTKVGIQMRIKMDPRVRGDDKAYVYDVQFRRCQCFNLDINNYERFSDFTSF